jgi:hypothetical protein
MDSRDSEAISSLRTFASLLNNRCFGLRRPSTSVLSEDLGPEQCVQPGIE